MFATSSQKCGLNEAYMALPHIELNQPQPPAWEYSISFPPSNVLFFCFCFLDDDVYEYLFLVLFDKMG